MTPLSANVNPEGDPNRLLDALRERKQLKNDAELCRALDVAPPLISKIRNRKLAISPALMIRMHDTFDMPINELRRLMT